MKKDGKKTFMVMNFGYFGDVVATSALCSEIKENYPDSKLLFLANPPCYDIAKNIPGVDEVYCFDKRGEHKGLSGMLKFLRSFEYWGKIDCCIMLHSYHRGNIFAFLLGAKRRISERTNPLTHFLVTDLYPSKKSGKFPYVPKNFANHLRILTNKEPNDELCFNCPEENIEKAQEILTKAGYDKYELIGLNTCSRAVEKDWKPKDAAEFISKVNESGRRVVFLGTQGAAQTAEKIRELGVSEFLDLSGKTTILETAGIIHHCKAFVSVDTGSMHLACAMKKPTVALFFLEWMSSWAPRDLKTNTVLFNPKGISGRECFNALEELLVRNYSKEVL